MGKFYFSLALLFLSFCSATAAAAALEHDGDVTSLALCPGNENLFLSSSVDRTVRLWDMRAGAAVQLFRAGAHDINDVAYFPSGFAFGW